jgi:uncharacterized protein (DUF2336 family)
MKSSEAAAATGACRCENGPDLVMGDATRVRPAIPTDEAQEVRDASLMVRASLAVNPATPPETNAVLADDADERVRVMLARKLGLLVPALSTGGQERLKQQTFDILTALAQDATVRVRGAIAEAVKDLPAAPRTVILRLAHDAEMQVCEPVIRFSPLLTANDLVCLVARAPAPGTKVAVARRASIDAAVCDAIAAGGTDDAVLALLMNGSAQIREATLDALVERSIEHLDWHDPLIRRPALSDHSARTLSKIVADHLLEVLAARSDLDPALAADLRIRVAAQMQQVPAAAEPAAPMGKPVEADLLAAAAEGDGRKSALMLAAAASVPLLAVRRAATLRSAKGLVSLAWKAGFSMQAGYAVQVLLAGLAPGSVMKPGPGNSFPMSVQEMSWQVEFLSGGDR